MDKMELLLLALKTESDPRKALELAREMAEFVGQPAGHAPMQIDGRVVDVVVTPDTEPGEASTIKKGPRSQRKWTEQERLAAAFMMDEGKSFEAIGNMLGRTPTGVDKAWRDGLIPSKRVWTRRVNKRNRKKEG